MGTILYVVLSLFLTNTNIIEGPTISYFLTALILAILIIIKHRKNITRLKDGTENKVSFKNNK